MPGDPSECRMHAQRCWALAAEASTSEIKTHFTDLAQRWAGLAADLEATERLLALWVEEQPDFEEPDRKTA
jgi:hypothetical protein